MSLVSVIVPVYKVEQYLERCINSILSQTFTDFELILVDDGSPDNSGKICDEYALKDNRVHVIHQENGGLSAARNAGIDWAFANSNSEYLSFIDSDDWVHPKFLEFLLKGVHDYNLKISACRIMTTDIETEPPELTYFGETKQWDAFYIMDTVSSVVAVNKLYSKGLFREYRYPVGKLHEDEFLTYKLLFQADRIAWIPEHLYYYYQNASSIMNSSYSLKRLDAIHALSQQREFARSIKNEAFYYKVTTRYLYHINKQINEIQMSSDIDDRIKNKNISILRAKMRRILITDGHHIAPIKEKRWYYEQAFPKINWVYWTLRGIIGKFI